MHDDPAYSSIHIYNEDAGFLKLSVRKLLVSDIPKISDYFLRSDPKFLFNIGIDHKKLPFKEEFYGFLMKEIDSSSRQKQSCHIIWEINGTPIGHSSINKIVYGNEAYLHLHIWNPERRYNGNGTLFIKASITLFFKMFNLKKLFCEPYALNQMPNKILNKLGFEFVKYYETTPELINYHQAVNQWVLTIGKWLHKTHPYY
ncbi:GNAT family N-acetyltransferase [Desulfosarcina ovata]|uniref:N-acetyltransferase domain-containing protein n=2 Tax=Desulfosarcina ovata TaxID=83564 RepID=A0A5K8A3W4_9BACT|nr:GNAT family protein [Desulfosarcina ovata]BBO80407.1 hypothetical protein DSCO28_09730 [Desulfosarcina ovata subsp. sediminis]BBO87161.1 hypothetical protein DSCOOX_03410 [Desulfosarcina ovata subsp. ovata]